MKHKHCELIKAWADGAEIEARETSYFSDDDNVWMETKTPTWSPYIEYRIKPKPKTIKYRLYLWASVLGGVEVQSYPEQWNCSIEKDRHFIKWLGDWQEVEV